MRIRALLLTIAAGTLALAGLATAAGAAEDPVRLQQQAIKRIDAFVDHFRKTGDYRSRSADLVTAQGELVACYQGFMAQGDLANAALCLLKLGDTQRMQSRWQPALEVYREAEKVARQARDETHLARALMRQAQVETSTSDHTAALAHIDQSIRAAEPLPDRSLLFNAHDVKAQIQAAQGDLAGAADSLNRAFTVVEQIADESLLFYGYFDRADVYFKLAGQCDFQRTFAACDKRLDLAAQDYRQARSIAQKLGWPGLVKEVDGFLSRLELQRSLYKGQADLGETIAQKSIFKPKRAGDVLVTEEFVSASPELAAMIQPVYEESLRYTQLAGGFADATAARSAFTEGLMREMRGDAGGAVQHYYKAIELVERDRRRLSDEKSRGSFLEDKISFYHVTIRQLLQQRRYAEAFTVMERSKSRAMADLLAARELTLSDPRDRALYAELVQMRTRIASQQTQLFALTTGPPDARTKERITQSSAAIQVLEAEHARLLARIGQEAPRVQELVVARPASLDQLQRAMREERFEVLQYLVLDTGLILWHIGPDTVTVRNVFIPRSELVAKVAALQKSLADPKEAFDQETARELFLFLIQPAVASMRGNRLVIIPHEELHQIPFQALVDPANNQVLGERFQISSAPSATVLLALKPAGAIKGGRLLAVADPDILAAPDEVQAIAQLYPAGSKVVTQTLARETDLKGWVGNYDLVHLSVHGKYVARDPLLSFLKLAPGGPDDGQLTAAEVFGLPLGAARLVVLSACETAKAEVTRGDELIGLQRALIYAGAGSLVLSQWEVDADSTALWMRTFYQEAQSKPLPEAGRLALLAVKSHAQYRHPHHWAAFTLVTR